MCCHSKTQPYAPSTCFPLLCYALCFHSHGITVLILSVEVPTTSRYDVSMYHSAALLRSNTHCHYCIESPQRLNNDLSCASQQHSNSISFLLMTSCHVKSSLLLVQICTALSHFAYLILSYFVRYGHIFVLFCFSVPVSSLGWHLMRAPSYYHMRLNEWYSFVNLILVISICFATSL